MALDADNVHIGNTGAGYVAPIDTTPPTAYNTSLNAAYKDVGYLSDDGVTIHHADDATEITAWQGAVVVRRVRTSTVASFEFTMIEVNKASLGLFFDETPAGGALHVAGASSTRKKLVIDVLDGDTIMRHVLNNAEVTERGDIVYSNGGDPVGYPVTVTAYPDDDGYVYSVYSNDPAFS